MPLEPNKTKNQIDLNEIDVSSLTLVERGELIDDLSKRLRQVIRESFEDGIADVQEELDAMQGVSPNAGNGSGAPPSAPSGNQPSQPSSPRQPKAPKPAKALTPEQEFEKLRKLESSTRKVIDRLSNLQKKKNKDNRAKSLEGNVYTGAGKRFAGGINEIADTYHDLSLKELDEAKSKLAEIQEGIRFGTIGKENKLLTDATLRLQEELARETKKRGTFLGKIGETMTKSNINITSVLLGFTSHSPLMGMMTKYWLDTIHDFKEEREKKRAEAYKVADLEKALPRPDEPIPDNSPVKMEDETLRKHLGEVSDPDVRQATLENLLNKGQITPEQHKNLSAELLPPDHQPLWERLGSTPSAQAPGAPVQQPTAPAMPSAPTATPQPVSNQPMTPEQVPDNVLRDSFGNPIRDWEKYERETPKKQKQKDENDAWLEYIYSHAHEKDKKEYEERLKTPIPEDWDEELFGDYYAKPSAMSFYENRKREKYTPPAVPYKTIDNQPPIYSNVVPTEAPFEEKMAAAPELVRRHELIPDPPESTHPEKLQTEDRGLSSLTNLMKATQSVEEDEAKKLELLSSEKDGPLANLEKISEKQLEELKKINKYLETQIEQADLAADAARRETGPDGDSALASDMGNRKKGGGGFFGGIIESLIGGSITGIIGKYLRKMLGFSKAEEGVAAAGKSGWLRRVFGGASKGTGAAGKALEGVEAVEGAGAAGKALKGAKGVAGAAEEVGAFSKVLNKLGGFGKVLGKLGGIGKLLGKLALPLTIIMGVIDFLHGFVNAEEFLGMGKKLTIMDRVAGGIGGVVKGLVGIVDLIFGLFGVKTDIGGILGKGVAKVFSAFFKLIGSFFKVIMAIFKPIMKILGPIIEFIAKHLMGLIETIADFIEGIADFIEGLADIATALFEDDPAAAIQKGLDLIWKGLQGIFTAIVNFILRWTGLKYVMDSFETIKKAFTSVFEKIGNMIGALGDFMKAPFEKLKDIFMSGFNAVTSVFKDWFGEDTFNFISETLSSIKDFLISPFEWLKKKILGGDDKKEETGTVPPPPMPKAPGLPPGYNPKTGKIEEAKKPFHMPTWRTGNYDEPQLPEAPALPPSPVPTSAPVPVGQTPLPPPPPPKTPEPTIPPQEPVKTAPSQTPVPTQAPTTPTPTPTTPEPRENLAKKTQELHQSPSMASRIGGGLSTAVGTGLGVFDGLGPLRLGRDQMRNVDILKKELQGQGMNEKQIAAVLGNVGKESNFTVNTEGRMGGRDVFYSRSRAEEVFGKERLDKLGITDDDLKSHERFYNKIYGANDRVGRGMGNLQEGDGYRFRGRGFIQLTGRNNYAQASKEIFGDDRLVKNPDLVSDPNIAAKVTSWYINKHGKTMAQKMGVDLQSGSQSDINLAYTSAIAGRKITRGQGYLGGKDIIGKVDRYAAMMNRPQPTGGSQPVMASAQPLPTSPQPNPALMAAALPPPVQQGSGMRLSQVTSTNSALMRTASNKVGTTNSIINKPSTNVTNNNTTVMHNIRSKNTDTSYERLMNQNAVAT